MQARLSIALSIFALFQVISGVSWSEYLFGKKEVQSSFHAGKNAAFIGDQAKDRNLIAKTPKSRALAQTNFIINNSTAGVCICVTIGSCALAGGSAGSNDGSGTIDIRIVNNLGQTAATVSPVSSGLTPAISSQNFCASGLERCCPQSGYSCGVRYPPVSSAKAAATGQAAYGAYPWQAVILGPGDSYVGSGALIDHYHVITAAHKVSTFLTNGQPLKIRMGEWDASQSIEPFAPLEFFASRIFIHPQFTAANLKNDIAIIRMASPVPLGQVPTISTICLPSNMLSNARCWVAGWGRNDFSNNGAYQAIMKEVDVPLVDHNNCQNQLRATRLGQNFVLDTVSFMCAGGEAGKDACTGDGGSPLVCSNSGKWFVMGLVAWGIGCGSTNVPGVYVNIPSYLSWIQFTTRS